MKTGTIDTYELVISVNKNFHRNSIQLIIQKERIWYLFWPFYAIKKKVFKLSSLYKDIHMAKNIINSEAICLCPLEGVIDVISKKWALLVINEIGNHERIRYNDLMKELGEISPKTLADTLKELGKYNLIKREPFNEIPPRVDYTLTKDGESLREAIIPILKWAISKKGTVVAHCSCSMIEKGKKIVR